MFSLSTSFWGCAKRLRRKGVSLCCFTGKEARGGIRSCWEVWWMPARKCFGKRKKLPETCRCGPCKRICKWWNPMNWDSTCAYRGLRKLLVFRPQRWRTSRRLLRRLKNEKKLRECLEVSKKAVSLQPRLRKTGSEVR